MIINKKDIVTLSDDIRYLVISKAEYEQKVYYLFAEVNNPFNIKFLVENNDVLTEINDHKMIRKIFPNLYKEVRDELK